MCIVMRSFCLFVLSVVFLAPLGDSALSGYVGYEIYAVSLDWDNFRTLVHL